MVTQARLKELFNYDPDTGYFTNKFSRGRALGGGRAGSPSGHGYRKLTVDYERHYEHHLAWLYMFGMYPGELDHVDGNRSNNTLGNLRPATRAQNCHNSPRGNGKYGVKGAYYDKRARCFFSKIQVGKQTIYLGKFSSPEEAGMAYQRAAEIHHGQYAVHKRPQNGD
jgi:hypothetical protein